MRWRNMRESDNIEDRRGQSSGGFGLGGGGGVKLGGLGLVAVVAISLLLGQNPLEILSMLAGDGGVATAPAPSSPGAPGAPGVRDEGKEFVARIVGDTEDTWGKIFQRMGRQYEAPRLVLFRGRVESACGLASSAVGPFYCPGDSQVYLDQSFFQELKSRFGAPGDFARGYVIAHEVGHHVQNLLGIAQQVEQQRARLSPTSRNVLSVRMELQADCFAGVWGYYAKQRGLLEPGDLESGLTAAAAIGDDRLQQQTQGSVRPETFTHGSSAQRVRLFKAGFESGDIRQCDTFAARER
jgi:predicted metalloprotease